MKSRFRSLIQLPIFPLFPGIYSVLFLWLANYTQVQPFVILRPLAFVLALTAVVWGASWLLLRQPGKAAAVAALFLVLFFTYGHFYNFIANRTLFGVVVGRQLFLLLLWAVLFAGGMVWILRTHTDFQRFTRGLNLVGGVLLLLTISQLTYVWISHSMQAGRASAAVHANQITSPVQALDENAPDVYYIVLDGYDRQDLMAQDIHVDNQAFISQLEALGFVVPDCTQSNYNNTIFSVTATLNMNYLDGLGFPYSGAKKDLAGYSSSLVPLVMDNQVMHQFKDLGYQIITLKNSYYFIDFPNSDIVYDYQASQGWQEKIEVLNFLDLFYKTTLVYAASTGTALLPEPLKGISQAVFQYIDPGVGQNSSAFYLTYQQNQYQLDKLEAVAQEPGKKFLYAHLMVTHKPFTFTATGGLRAEAPESKAAYADSIAYANQRILTIVKDILAQSRTPPIIILQGDHGFGLPWKGKDAFRILNAYYLPQNGKEKLYPKITPVNTFRLIFDEYFHMDFPLLQDQSIFIDQGFTNGFQIVPQTCVNP
ncbi:MAG: LTA synthase family protein [Chloroflexi bacterium]|nr:LTA synthase family protein [Chloroflexota bacterium]